MRPCERAARPWEKKSRDGRKKHRGWSKRDKGRDFLKLPTALVKIAAALIFRHAEARERALGTAAGKGTKASRSAVARLHPGKAQTQSRGATIQITPRFCKKSLAASVPAGLRKHIEIRERGRRGKGLREAFRPCRQGGAGRAGQMSMSTTWNFLLNSISTPFESFTS